MTNFLICYDSKFLAEALFFFHVDFCFDRFEGIEIKSLFLYCKFY